MIKTAVAYYRTSSAANVTDETDPEAEDVKDSKLRQEDACRRYAERHGLEIVSEYYDAPVRGTVAIAERPAFTAMLSYMLGNGARIILVENAGRFARDLVVQITGHDLLKKHGIELVPVDAPGYFMEETPTAIMVRNILGAVSQFERMSTAERMRKGRERKILLTGRCGGHPSVPDGHKAAARELAAEGLSLRAVSAAMAARGMIGVRSAKPYPAASIRKMVEESADA